MKSNNKKISKFEIIGDFGVNFKLLILKLKSSD